jgi:hypothetical protein
MPNRRVDSECRVMESMPFRVARWVLHRPDKTGMKIQPEALSGPKHVSNVHRSASIDLSGLGLPIPDESMPGLTTRWRPVRESAIYENLIFVGGRKRTVLLRCVVGMIVDISTVPKEWRCHCPWFSVGT